MLEEKFPFIRDDIYLVAQVDEKTGKQFLIMQKINKTTNRVEVEDRIECIHTAITRITPDQYTKIQQDDEKKEELLKEVYNFRSSENLKQVNLSPEDRFFAMKSWVQGIAEAGVDSLYFQGKLDFATRSAYPIVNRLAQFIIRVDPSFLPSYLERIERECTFEGELHVPSYISNIQPIIQLVSVSKIPDGLEKYYIYDETTKRYILRNSKSMTDIYDLFEMNLMSIGGCSYETIAFLWETNSELIADFLFEIEVRYQEGTITVQNIIDNLTELWCVFLNEYYRAERSVDEIIQHSINIIPPTAIFEDELNEIFFELSGNYSENYVNQVLEYIYKTYSEKSQEIKPCFYKNLTYLFENIAKLEIPSHIAKLILDIIPTQAIFEPEYGTLFWYLILLGKHTKISDFLNKVRETYSREFLIEKVDKVIDILILGDNSNLIPERYLDWDYIYDVQFDAYESVDDYIDYPYTLYLKEREEFAKYLFEILPISIIIEKFSFMDVLALTLDSSILVGITEKLLSNHPNSFQTENIKKYEEFRKELSQKIIIHEYSLDNVWIPSEIWRKCYTFHKFSSHDDYYYRYSDRESGIAVLNDFEKIVPLISDFIESPQWKERLNLLQKTSLGKGILSLYPSFLKSNVELNSDEYNALIELSKQLGKGILPPDESDFEKNDEYYQSIYNRYNHYYDRRYNRPTEDLMRYGPSSEKYSVSEKAGKYLFGVYAGRVKWIYLPYKKLKSIPAAIMKFPYLRKLYLDGNAIEDIPPDFITALPELILLDISNNKISEIPEEIIQWGRLTHLNLSNNNLTSLPESIKELRLLKELDISGNKFDVNPQSQKAFHYLKTLRQYGCNIKPYYYAIPEETKVWDCPECQEKFIFYDLKQHMLTHHKEIYNQWMYENAPDDFPAVGFNGKIYMIDSHYHCMNGADSVKLDLHYHRKNLSNSSNTIFNPGFRKKIEEIENIDHFEEWSQIEQLDLSGQKIQQLYGFDHLKNLTWLDLSKNKIESLTGVRKLEKLEVLLLDNNKICDLVGLVYLPNLKVLSLNNNNLEEFNAILYDLSNLEYLSLEGNVGCIVNGILDLRKLSYLNLKGCTLDVKDLKTLYYQGWQNGHSLEDFIAWREGRVKFFSFEFKRPNIDLDKILKIKMGFKDFPPAPQENNYNSYEEDDDYWDMIRE